MAQKRLFLSEEEIVRQIKSILVAIRSPEHAEDIIELQKIYKKNVPFFDRSYFSTFLLKEALKTGNILPSRTSAEKTYARGDRAREEGRDKRGSQRKEEGRDRELRGNGKASNDQGNNSRIQGQSREQKNREQKSDARNDDTRSQQTRNVPLPEGVASATLFVSAGRKRHFYPRHFLDILDENGISREAVGEIRLFDNYTFVQVRAENATEMVEKLDGVLFKGRKLTVNPARKREEAADSSSYSTSSDYGTEETGNSLFQPTGDDDQEPMDEIDASNGDSLDTSFIDDDSEEENSRPAGLGTGGYETDYAGEEDLSDEDIEEDLSDDEDGGQSPFNA